MERPRSATRPRQPGQPSDGARRRSPADGTGSSDLQSQVVSAVGAASVNRYVVAVSRTQALKWKLVWPSPWRVIRTPDSSWSASETPHSYGVEGSPVAATTRIGGAPAAITGPGTRVGSAGQNAQSK